jgi:hypothetical protein
MTVMDLLDFEGQAMYFDTPLGDEPERLLQEAAACYPHERAEHLLLRLGDPESAVERLRKVVQLDSNDRLGAGPLLDLALGAMAEPSGRNDDGISVAEA